ncbi:MAG TPA: hypothetical protein VMM18_18215 [Gemmatimonadaceae bacterium]|nr:hypothetical protein [Gemmatimonadaceae bacterium]
MRLAAAAGGAATLVLATVFTFGTALGAPLGMAIASGLRRRRGAHLTRLAGWIAGVTGAAAVALSYAVVALSLAPDGIMDSVREEAAAEQQRAREQPTRVERALERFQQRNAATEAMERRAEAMVESDTFFWMVTMIGLAIASVMVGLVAGSIGWGASVLLMYAVRGRAPPPAV